MTQNAHTPPKAGNANAKHGAIAFLLKALDGLREQALYEAPSVTAEHIKDERDKGPRAKLGALMGQLDERAYGLLLLLLALPCCLPFLYGLPQIVALPMIALAGQLAIGRPSPWLPQKLSDREFAIGDFEVVLNRADKYIGWFERLAHPRLGFVTSNLGSRIIGGLLLIPCASILIPLPLTNTVPGVSVAIAAIGLIERDGLLTLFGVVCGLFWVLLLVTVGVEGIQLFKDFVLGA